ncbi:MAG: hypothetical protein U9O41_08405 [Candidatus Aerophobetes bacterium]|nr:hypothetical protein [Candidatus Aerophobetes bacterium]
MNRKKEIGRLICYRIRERLTSGERTRFSQKLYGYKDRSFYGHHEYLREGILTKVPHIIPVRAAIITRKIYAKSLEEFLKKYAQVRCWNIILTERDLKAMRMEAEDKR